jgi:hypothetical protein
MCLWKMQNYVVKKLHKFPCDKFKHIHLIWNYCFVFIFIAAWYSEEHNRMCFSPHLWGWGGTVGSIRKP